MQLRFGQNLRRHRLKFSWLPLSERIRHDDVLSRLLYDFLVLVNFKQRKTWPLWEIFDRLKILFSLSRTWEKDKRNSLSLPQRINPPLTRRFGDLMLYHWATEISIMKFIIKDSHLYIPTPLLIFGRQPPPWYIFHSLPSPTLPLKSKMAAIISVKKILRTHPPKLPCSAG